MASTSHHVTFRFRLPPALMLRAPLGFWPRSPRGCTLDVGENGNILVTSVDRSETYATRQVVETAGAFLRSIDSNVQPMSLPATLSAPSCRERPVTYAISLGARVSIARTGERPIVFGPEQLDLLNHAAG